MMGYFEGIKIILLAIMLIEAIGKNGTSNAETISKNQYKLSGSVVPLNYDIRLSNIDFSENIFKGRIKILVQTVRSTNKLTFHVGNTMSVIKAKVNIQDQKSLKVQDNFYNSTTEIWTIILKDKVPVSTTININLMYIGQLRTDMFGFYKSSYIDENGNEIWLAGTQFQPIFARHAFPCFDEPIYKSKFTISISPPKDYNCLSNMPKKDIFEMWHRFEESVPMSTYLVAFVISDFKSLSKDNFHAWTRPTRLQQTTYSLDVGLNALDYFTELYNVPDQLGKMDMVAMPDLAYGAMENWGLITLREVAMLYDKDDSSDHAKQRTAVMVMHEYSHLWIGNLVTAASWGNMWLNEGFSYYFEYMAIDKIEKNWKMEEQFVVNRLQILLTFDAQMDSQPMKRNDKTTEDIIGIGGSIVGTKAACIIRMIKKSFGSKIFKSALRSYIKERKYKTVTPSDLWQAFQTQIDTAQINVSISTVMKNWVEKAGFPCVSVIIKPKVISLKQKRFFIQKPKSIPEEQIWSIPITWLTSTQANREATPSTKPIHWLSSRNANWSIENQDAEWTILNVNSAGYYRVNYDKDSWNKIIEALTNGDFEKIPVLNRAAIVDDLMNLARAGLLDYDTALRGLQYLKRETNYLPFKSAFTSLDYLMRLFSTSENADIFKSFVINLFKHIYDNLTYEDKSDDDRLTILLRHEINEHACNLQYTYCIEKSKQYFSEWMKNNTPVPKNQRSTAYCTAIKYGSDTEWDFLWKQHQTTNSASEQETILKALGCSTNTTILQKYILRTLRGFSSSLIHKQDVNTVFSGIYTACVENADFMVQFVTKKYRTFIRHYGSNSEIAVLILSAMRSYPSKTFIEKIMKLLRYNRYVSEFEILFENDFKEIKAEIKWSKLYLPIVSNWIREH